MGCVVAATDQENIVHLSRALDMSFSLGDGQQQQHTVFPFAHNGLF